MSDKPKQRYQFRLLTLFCLMTLVAVLCGGALLLPSPTPIDYGTGPVESSSDFPEPLRELLCEAKQRQIEIDSLRVFCVQDYGDKTFFWEMKASAELIALATEKWELVPLKKSHAMYQRFWDYMPKFFAAPPKGNELNFYINKGWLDGSTYGIIYVVLHDKTADRLVVLYCWRF